MNILLFGIWETPISDYWFFYFVLGIAGFLLCYLNRYLLVLVIPVIIWFSVSDFQNFYHSVNVRPDSLYIFWAFLSMMLAMTASVFGALMNKRKVKSLS
ncbi:MAG: hypothetical protein WKF90_08025 [Pyrinomonadaceae bacterium]